MGTILGQWMCLKWLLYKNTSVWKIYPLTAPTPVKRKEMADKMAKKATQNYNNFTVHKNKSETKKVIKYKLKKEWEKDGIKKTWFQKIKIFTYTNHDGGNVTTVERMK